MLEMKHYPIDHIWCYLLAAFVFEGLAVYLWQYRKSLGAWPLLCLLLNRSCWLICISIIAATNNLADKTFWLHVLQIPINFSATIWLLFVLQATGQGRWTQGWQLVSLLLFPTIICFIVFTNPLHYLYWQQILFTNDILTTVRGPACFVSFIYNYIIVLVILYYSYQWIYRSTGLRRLQALLVTITLILGLIGNSFWFFKHNATAPSPILFSALMAVGIWIYSFFYLRILNILPLAHAAAVEITGNCFAVIDNHGWLLELNSSAAQALKVTPIQAVGKLATEVFAVWPNLAALLKPGTPTLNEISREENGCRHYYEVYVVVLKAQAAQQLGQALVWRDITLQKQAQLQLLEQQKALSVLHERNLLGREIHDDRAQLGSYLQMELQTIAKLLEQTESAAAKTQLARLIATTSEFNVNIRETIAGLKTRTCPQQSFLTTLQEYLAWYEKRYSILTEFILLGNTTDGIFNIATEMQLLRIIQEALTNVRKHADASKVQIIIETSLTAAEVCIIDNGSGFDTTTPIDKKSHCGLTIMHERAKEFGGSFRLEAQTGAGTKVIISFPLTKID